MGKDKDKTNCKADSWGQVVPVTGVLDAQRNGRLDKSRASPTQHYIHFVHLFVVEAVWCIVDCLIVRLASTH